MVEFSYKFHVTLAFTIRDSFGLGFNSTQLAKPYNDRSQMKWLSSLINFTCKNSAFRKCFKIDDSGFVAFLWVCQDGDALAAIDIVIAVTREWLPS
jgi:hypothetical protein